MLRLFLLAIGSCFFYLPVQAQVCGGSLGDPVLKMTFGRGPTGPMIPPSSKTGFTYSGSPCVKDGQFSLATFFFGCSPTIWYSPLAGDHTGTTSVAESLGYFMMVNADVPGKVVYQDTATGLCGNTNYEFAAWIMNAVKDSSCGFNSIKPNLIFRIETVNGVLLKEQSSGDIPTEKDTRKWVQAGTCFLTPIGSTAVVLKIINNAAGGCGNDFALDDITLRPGGAATVATTVNGQANYLIDICQNLQTDLSLVASISGLNNAQMQWQESLDSGKTWKDIVGETGLQYTRKPSLGGGYQYRIMVAETGNFNSPACRLASEPILVNINPIAPKLAVHEVMACTGINVSLDAPLGTAYQYLWSGPNQYQDISSNAVVNKVQFQDSGYYKVRITTDAGCVGYDSIHVIVNPGVNLQLPQSVTTCEGIGVALSANGGTSYQWSPSMGLSNATIANPIANPTDTISYTVKVQNQFACRDSGSIEVQVWKKPLVAAGKDKSIASGETVQLDGSISGNYSSFNWSPTNAMLNPSSINPSVQPTQSTQYILTGISSYGCGNYSDTVLVNVFQELIIPNAFSPNGDGINDFWKVRGLETYPDAVVSIFNRYGQPLFKQKSSSTGWDGKRNGQSLPIGTYYYMIELNNGYAPVSGSILLIR